MIDLKASQCRHLSAQDPHPLCAQQLEQNHGLLLMIDFKDESNWSIPSFVSPRSVSGWCNAVSFRLCGCNDVSSSEPILGILVPKPSPNITVNSFGIKSKFRTKMTVLRWFTGWWSSCNLRSGWIHFRVCFSCGVHGVRSKSDMKKLSKHLILKLTKTTAHSNYRSHPSNTF